MKYFYIALDTLVCLMLTAALVHYNHTTDQSKWLWLDILTSALIVWVMAEAFVKAYLYDQLKENESK